VVLKRRAIGRGGVFIGECGSLIHECFVRAYENTFCFFYMDNFALGQLKWRFERDWIRGL
jgi:AAA+ superfamily predicted ATPase